MFIFLGLLGCSSHSVRVINNTKVLFSAQIKEAKTVQFVSSDSGYQPILTHKREGSWWDIEISGPVKADVMYFYMVDGEVYLPECAIKEVDDFGGENCVYEKE